MGDPLVPEFEKRWYRWARRVNSSWRVDETYIRVRGKWHFLHRAVDKYGKTVDSGGSGGSEVEVCSGEELSVPQ
jgi:transposase-like protein